MESQILHELSGLTCFICGGWIAPHQEELQCSACTFHIYLQPLGLNFVEFKRNLNLHVQHHAQSYVFYFLNNFNDLFLNLENALVIWITYLMNLKRDCIFLVLFVIFLPEFDFVFISLSL